MQLLRRLVPLARYPLRQELHVRTSKRAENLQRTFLWRQLMHAPLRRVILRYSFVSMV